MGNRTPVWVHKAIHLFAVAWGLVVLFASVNAYAVPAFARQTGENCITCHVNFPELTPFGRYFKLSGYTLGKKADVPLSVMLQVASTTLRNTTSGGMDQTVAPASINGRPILEQTSLFLAGKLTDNIGIFNQWTAGGDGTTTHTQIDNTDIRYADRIWAQDVDFMYGLTLNNNPTVQDVWNSTPAFGYPYAASKMSGLPGTAASTLIDGGLGQSVAGLGGYFYWNKTLYAEVSSYRTADRGFSVFRAGTNVDSSASPASALDGYNPYWRLALTHEMGPHSFMIGTFGMNAKVYPNGAPAPTGPTDKFKDIGWDAQYQYITDPHTFTAQLTSIRETTDWNSDPTLGSHDNPSSTLETVRAKAMYQYDRKYGLTLAYFATTGSTDNLHYNCPDGSCTGGTGVATALNGSLNGSPETRGNSWELHYLPRQNIKLSATYTHYTKFNGASTNYDGNGRNAGDNDTLYLLGWFMF